MSSAPFWTAITRDNRVAMVNCAETYWATRDRGSLWTIMCAENLQIMEIDQTTRQVTAWRPAA